MKKAAKFLKKDEVKIVLSLSFFLVALCLEFFALEAVSLAFYIAAIAAAGWQVFLDAVRGILRRDLLDEKFLMSIASLGAMALGEWSEGAAVMIFFLVGETFEHRAVRKSRSSIRALMDICPDEATVLIDGREETVDAEDVEVGSIIVIRPGERVPVDCLVIEGSADVDTSSMTGEPIPRSIRLEDELSSGYVVINGLIKARTLRPASESSASRVLQLVETATDNKSKEEAFITRFSRVYTPIVVAAALIMATVPPLFSLMSINESVYTALTFLVISCPCALVISVPMAFFGGIGGAASRGILYKGGNVFSALSRVDTVAFDKTGTITTGDFSVREVLAIGVEREELLRVISSAESVSNHPIANCLKTLSNQIDTPDEAQEIAGLGVVASLAGESILVGNRALMHRYEINIDEVEDKSGAVYVAKNGKLIGVTYMSDSIKKEAATAISALRSLGVKRSVILSGDKKDNVIKAANEVDIDTAYYELTPEDKYKKLEELIAASDSTMYVGDGINDAPSLARADVGVAMGSVGQDSAIEAADVVIMTDNLYKICEAIQISRKTLHISWQNIIFALGTKAVIMLLGVFGMANMWLAVFADVGVAVLAILNSMRALKYTGKKY